MKAKVSLKNENIQRFSDVHDYSKDEQESDWEKARNLYYSNHSNPGYYKEDRLENLSNIRNSPSSEVLSIYLFFYVGVHLCSVWFGNGVYFLLLAGFILCLANFWPNVKAKFLAKWLTVQNKKKMLL